MVLTFPFLLMGQQYRCVTEQDSSVLIWAEGVLAREVLSANGGFSGLVRVGKAYA